MNLYRVEFRKFKSDAQLIEAPSIGAAKKEYYEKVLGHTPHGNHWKGTMYARVIEKDIESQEVSVDAVYAGGE